MPRMSGKRAMIEQLMADGVRRIFGNPGTTEQGFMDALRDYPQMEFMLALHEGVAVCMADAYARVARRPAFVEVHIAPGLGNALGMLHNAAVGKTPLVVYAGQSPGATLLQEPHLSGPLVDMARPVCKWAAQVHHAHDVPRACYASGVHDARQPPLNPGCGYSLQGLFCLHAMIRHVWPTSPPSQPGKGQSATILGSTMTSMNTSKRGMVSKFSNL